MKLLYRYELKDNTVIGGLPDARVILYTFEVIKETPKGFWIANCGYPTFFGRKWVSNYSKKRFAYPSEDQALESAIARSDRRLKILKHQTLFVTVGLGILKNRENIHNYKKSIT